MGTINDKLAAKIKSLPDIKKIEMDSDYNYFL